MKKIFIITRFLFSSEVLFASFEQYLAEAFLARKQLEQEIVIARYNIWKEEKEHMLKIFEAPQEILEWEKNNPVNVDLASVKYTYKMEEIEICEKLQ